MHILLDNHIMIYGINALALTFITVSHKAKIDLLYT